MQNPYCNCLRFFLLLLLFRRKTERAAQTVRARELKPGQIVVVVAGTRNPKACPNRPIGGATAQKTKISHIFGHSSLKIDRRFKKMTSLRSLGQPAKKCITTDFLSDARFFRKIDLYSTRTLTN